MKLCINSFDYCLGLPENYLKVIRKYAKNGNVNMVKDDGYETAIIEIDSLDILPKFEKDLRKARGIVKSFDFAVFSAGNTKIILPGNLPIAVEAVFYQFCRKE